MNLRLGDADERRHVVVVIEKHVNLYTALRTSVVRPREQRQAERDGRRVEREQLVFEPELRLPRSQMRHRPETGEEFVEEILEKSRWAALIDETPKRSTSRSIRSEAEDDSQKNVRRSPAYCIGQRASFWRCPDSQMDKLSVAAGQAVDDLPEGVSSRKMTKEHRNKLRLASESLGMAFRFVFENQFFKVHEGKISERLYPKRLDIFIIMTAPYFRDVVALADMMISQDPGRHISKILFGKSKKIMSKRRR